MSLLIKKKTSFLFKSLSKKNFASCVQTFAYFIFPIPYNPQETSLILSQNEAPPLLTPVISGNSQRGDMMAFK